MLIHPNQPSSIYFIITQYLLLLVRCKSMYIWIKYCRILQENDEEESPCVPAAKYAARQRHPTEKPPDNKLL